MLLPTEEFGELFEETFDSEAITWKIPHVFSLPKYDGYYVQSRPFSFANATWCLRMYPSEEADGKSGRYIDLMIARLHSHVPHHEVFYKICFKTRRGREFDSFSSKGNFNANDTEWGVAEYIEQSQFVAKKDTIVPNGNLTVICQMRVKKSPAIEACSQTELAGSGENLVEEVGPPAATSESKLLRDFGELLRSEEDSDVTVEVQGQKFRAHRAILKARSSVFASMFRNDMKEKNTGVVDVEDCEPDSFPDFLRFLYCGSVEKLSEENVFSLYTDADKYDVQDLKSECVEFMRSNLSVDTFCDTIALSLRHSETELIKLATDFFAKNLQKIIVTVKWQTFVTENPIRGNELFVKALVNDKQTNK